MISTKDGVKWYLWLKPPKSWQSHIPRNDSKHYLNYFHHSHALVNFLPTWKEPAPSGSRTSIGHCAIAVAEGNTISDPWGIDNSFGKEVAIFHDFFWFLSLLIGARDSHQGQRMQQAMQVLDRMSPSHLLLLPRANLQFSVEMIPCC